MSKIARVIIGYSLVAIGAVLIFITNILATVGTWFGKKIDGLFPRQKQFLREVADSIYPSSTEYLKDLEEKDG